ncbi:MAG TPA: PilZ domain-containing protein [Nitrospira sp.]|nr:PilZ domain-containing protein [Nitrospira sp.]
MKSAKPHAAKFPHSVHSVCDRRQQPRAAADFRLMYSAQTGEGEVLIGDGAVTDVSRNGLGITGTAAVRRGTELTLFLYLPDGRDPLFVMEARVAWAEGRRFGIQITRMDLREQNRLRYFLMANRQLCH